MLPLLIVGGILLALAALLLAPVRLELSFREAFSAQVRYLFFRIPLAPGKEEEPPRPKRRPRLGKRLPRAPAWGRSSTPCCAGRACGAFCRRCRSWPRRWGRPPRAC